MKRVAIIGQNGQVSTYLQRELPQISELVVLGREDLDLAQPESIEKALDSCGADLVVNPAAYTAVDKAEEESDLAYQINADSAGAVAAWCAKAGVPLVHFSTDYVFDGLGKTPYTELDSPSPTGVYGASKLAGERAILQTGAHTLILRTSWVYSNHGKNFYKTMLQLAETRDELSVVADQIGSPTYAGSIAVACRRVVGQLLANSALAEERAGVYHFTCGGETSWHGFAEALFNENGVKNITVHPIPTSAYPTPAKRPAYSVLANNKLQEVFGIGLPHWQEALASCAREQST